MKIRSRLAATFCFAFSLTLGLATSAAAAECHLRNLVFVSIANNGDLRINSEMWDASTGAVRGNIANATVCNVNSVIGGIPTQVCRSWYQTAMTAMITERKIYMTLPGSSCPVGNPLTFSGVGYFGLIH